jgi:hypothetical protein
VGTVYVAEQVTGFSQELVTVKMTVVVPPQIGGAPVLLLLKVALQPPLKPAVFSHAAKSASSCACVGQRGAVALIGQVRFTAGGFDTVKVAEQVTGASQELVTVKTTVVDPPQAFGAPVLLLLKVALHPPLVLTVFNQALNLLSIAA